MTLNDFFIGWETPLQELLQRAGNTFPPQNVANLEDGSILIELALAGYGKNDVEVSVEQDVLNISSNGVSSNKDLRYSQKGIAKRKFKKTFLLNKNHEVKSANMNDGLLSVVISPVVPAEKSVKLITVN